MPSLPSLRLLAAGESLVDFSIKVCSEWLKQKCRHQKAKLTCIFGIPAAGCYLHAKEEMPLSVHQLRVRANLVT